MVYSGVKTERGDQAAQSFVQMVASMTTDVSATTFLVSFYRLEQANWKFGSVRQPKNSAEAFAEVIADATRKDPETGRSAGIAGIFSYMSGDNRNSSPASWIMREFLTRHLDGDHANRPASGYYGKTDNEFAKK